MAKKPTALSPNTLYASVNDWLDQLDGDTTALRNDGASLPFWLGWASHVLKSHGVDTSWRSMTLGDMLRAPSGSALDGGQSEACARVAAFRESVSPKSPEWHAATLWLEATADRWQPRWYRGAYEPGERPVMAIGRMYAQIERERLQSDADRGRQARAIRAKGGVGAARKREENLGRLGWRKAARRLDSMMDDDYSRKERAYIIANRLNLSERTVYDALPRRRSQKSSR